MNLQDFSDKVGEIRNRVSDKMDEYAEDVQEFEEEHEIVGKKEAFFRAYGHDIKRVAYVLAIFMAASYGARYGVNLAVKSGQIKIKKK